VNALKPLGSDHASNIGGKQWKDVQNTVFLVEDETGGEIEKLGCTFRVAPPLEPKASGAVRPNITM